MKYLDRKPSEYIADFKDFCKDLNLDENDDNSIEKYINEFIKWHIMFKGIGYVQMEAMELEDVLLSKERYSLEEDKNKEENNEETLDEILERAISEEKDAINTYDDILEKVDNKDLEDMIKEIKSDEEEHQKLLEHYLETGEALADDELNKLEKEKKTENKKLIESHLDDYSSEKRYQVTYISKDGEEDKVTYKPTKNTNIAGVQKELGNKYKDFFKLKDIQEIEGEVENMKNEDLDLLDSEELIEKDTLTEATSLSAGNEEEIYYLQDRILDYEKHGIGTKKEYEKNLDRLQQLQSGDMSENKKITEDTERDDVTEYVISFEDMNDDEYFEDKEEADKRFEELKSNKELNKVHQYYRKDWNWDEESESYIEGYVEVFYTNGDLVEESFEDELADAKADSIEKGLYTESNERGYLHIEFTDGSNPYIKFVDNKKELDAEIKKWSKEFNIETVKDIGSKLFVKATPKRKEPDLFDLDELDESEKLIEGASNFEELKNQIIDAYHSVLPNCGCTVEKGALGKDTFFVTFYLAKDNSEFPNKIAQNDLFNISFFITPDTRDINLDEQLPETFNLEVNGNTILTKPDNQYMAYGSVRVPLRKVSGSPDKIVQTITKYAQKTKEVLEKLVNDDKIPEDRKELVISKL